MTSQVELEIIGGAITSVNGESWLNGTAVNRILTALCSNHAEAVNMESDVISSYIIGGTPRINRQRAKSQNKKTLMLPVCAGSHWTLYVVENKTDQRPLVTYYNSLPNEGWTNRAKSGLKTYLGTLFNENMDDCVDGMSIPEIPTQRNANDCGVCIVLCARAFLQQEDLAEDAFSPENIAYARRTIASELVLPTGLSLPEWVVKYQLMDRPKGPRSCLHKALVAFLRAANMAKDAAIRRDINAYAAAQEIVTATHAELLRVEEAMAFRLFVGGLSVVVDEAVNRQQE